MTAIEALHRYVVAWREEKITRIGGTGRELGKKKQKVKVHRVSAGFSIRVKHACIIKSPFAKKRRSSFTKKDAVQVKRESERSFSSGGRRTSLSGARFQLLPGAPGLLLPPREREREPEPEPERARAPCGSP